MRPIQAKNDKNRRQKTTFRPYFGHYQVNGKIETLKVYVYIYIYIYIYMHIRIIKIYICRCKRTIKTYKEKTS